MTREKLAALVELGDIDEIWRIHEAELRQFEKQAVRAAARNARIAAVKRLIGPSLAGLCIAAGIVTLCVRTAHQSVTAGAVELRSCQRGDTVACQAAVRDCRDNRQYWFGKRTIVEWDSRQILYRQAFRAATGHELPDPWDGE